MVCNFRNDMYLTSEALRLMQKTHKPDISAADWQVLTTTRSILTTLRSSSPVG